MRHKSDATELFEQFLADTRADDGGNLSIRWRWRITMGEAWRPVLIERYQAGIHDGRQFLIQGWLQRAR